MTYGQFLFRVLCDVTLLWGAFCAHISVRRWWLDRKDARRERLQGRGPVNVFDDQVFPDPTDDRWRLTADMGGLYAYIGELRVFEFGVSMNGETIVKGSRRTARFLKAIQDHRRAIRVAAARAEAEKLLEAGP